MMIDLEEFEFMIAHKITTRQLLLCFLIQSKNVALCDRYTANCEKFQVEDIEGLIHKGIVGLNTKGDGAKYYKLTNLIVTDKFTSNFPDSITLAEEFWKEYPEYILVNDTKYAARNMNYEDFSQAYISVIKGTKKRHKEMMDMIKKYKEANGGFAKIGLKNFFETRYYETALKEFGAERENKSNTKFL